MEDINYDLYKNKALSYLKDIDWKIWKDRKGGEYSDVLITLDIEVSTGYIINGAVCQYQSSWTVDYINSLEKISLCYIWMSTVDAQIIYGRTLESYLNFLCDMESICPVSKFIFVHNLSYEFQFLRNILDIRDMFARKIRKPMYFRHKSYEFRCSYLLTRLSLETWAREKSLPVKKLVGNLDYNILRTPLTDMTANELDYCFNDVLVMHYGLQEYIERYGHIKDIPLTQTGTVRREFNRIMKDESAYRKRLDKMQFTSFEEYQDAVDVFGGGLTRSNIIHTGHIVEKVRSRDRTSAYPWEIISKTFPMCKFAEVPPSYIDKYYGKPEQYSYIIEVELFDIYSVFFNTYLSAYKCMEIKKPVYDNGRLISADYVRITCTNVDYEDILKSYHIERQNILSLRYSLNGYLNDKLCLYIIELFESKTVLRGLEDKQQLYMKKKEELNGIYGMMVTKTIVDDIGYSGNDWTKDKLDRKLFESKIEDIKKHWYKNNTAFYHGVYIPAYARHSLWATVYELDDDIVYMDTDSNKHINGEEHQAYFERLNAEVEKKQEEVADRLGIRVDRLRPIQPNGKICSIGTWDDEGEYSRFKTLGVKRYAYEDSKGLHITVSGVPKTAANLLPSLEDFTRDFVFDFSLYDDMTDIPDNQKKKKMIFCYLDEQPEVVWNNGRYDEYKSTYQYGIASYATTYSMTLKGDYYSLIKKAYEQYSMGNPHNISDIYKAERSEKNEEEKKGTL